MCKKLWLSEAIEKYGVRFPKGRVNVINSHAGSGKSRFIYKELLENPQKYMDIKENPRWIYLTDTNALKQSIMSDLSLTPIEKKRKIDLYFTKTMSYCEFCNRCRDKSIDIESYDFIICDEIQNLFNYALKFTKEDDQGYRVGIFLLLNACSKVTIISLSATFDDVEEYYEKLIKKTKADVYYNKQLRLFRKVFSKEQLENIMCYKEQETYRVKNPLDFLKVYDFNENPSEKIFIGVSQIRQAKKICEWLTRNGISSIYLSSKSSHDNVPYEIKRINKMDISAEDKEFKINEAKNHLMTEEQLTFMKQLLSDKIDDKENQLRGQLQEYRVLICTQAYETGINVYDESVGIVILAFSKKTTVKQFRSRIRHDIRLLVCMPSKDDSNVDFTDIPPSIDEKYFNIPIDDSTKKELVSQYGFLNGKNETSFKSVKEYFEKHGFVFATVDKELRLFHSEDELKEYKASKKEAKKMAKREVRIDETRKYLDNIIGVDLNKEKQEELVNFINLRDNKGNLLKSTKLLTPYLLEYYDIQLISKQKRINGVRERVWILSY